MDTKTNIFAENRGLLKWYREEHGPLETGQPKRGCVIARCKGSTPKLRGEGEGNCAKIWFAKTLFEVCTCCLNQWFRSLWFSGQMKGSDS